MMMLLQILTLVVATADVPRPDTSTAEAPVAAELERLGVEVELRPRRAEGWGAYAISLHAHGFDEEADVAYAEAMRLDADEFKWPYFRAIVAAKTDVSGALEWLEDALAIDATYGPAFERRALLREGLGLEEEAYADLQHAYELLATPSAALHLGQAEMRRGNAEAALPLLEAARERWPQSKAVLETLARVHTRLGDRELARSFANAARHGREMPPITDPRLNEVADAGRRLGSFLSRADTYVGGGQFDRAVKELETAQQLGHDIGRVNEAIASVQLRRGANAACLEAGQTALDAGQDSATLRFVMGTALMRAQRLDEAQTNVDAGLAGWPNDARLARLHGQLLVARGKDAEAIAVWSEALQREDDPATRRVRAQTLSRMGRHDEAIAELVALTQRPTADHQTWLALGDAHRQSGDIDAAVEVYEGLIDGPAGQLATRSAASALISAERYDEAIERLDRGNARWPRNPNITNDLAWLLSTAPIEGLRDGPRALSLIEPIARRVTRVPPALLDTYAAALAETGRFDDAAAAMDRALDSVPSASPQHAKYTKRRDTYRAGRAWRMGADE